MRTVLTACLLVAGLNTASAEPARPETGTVPSGPAKAAIEGWFTAGRDVTCSGGDTVGDACDLGRGLAFRTAYDRTGTRAVAFVLYSPVVSNHVALAVAQFRRDGDDWTFVRTVRGIQGEGPGSVDFQGAHASFAMAVPMPGDAPCCYTGTRRYDLDLETGVVTAASTASAKAASRPEPAPPATAGFDGTAFTHNGSIVLVDERLGEIRYDDPKASMRGVVGKGTVLFRGDLRQGRHGHRDGLRLQGRLRAGAVRGRWHLERIGDRPARDGAAPGSALLHRDRDVRGERPRDTALPGIRRPLIPAPRSRYATSWRDGTSEPGGIDAGVIEMGSDFVVHNGMKVVMPDGKRRFMTGGGWPS